MSTGTQIEVVMPQMGVSVSEGTITRWLKQPGEPIALDEPLLEISTDKVDTEVPSPGEGVVAQILVQEGETVEVGTVLAVIAPAGTPAAEPEPALAPAPEAGGVRGTCCAGASGPGRSRTGWPRSGRSCARASGGADSGGGERTHLRLTGRGAHRGRARRRPRRRDRHRPGRPRHEEGHPRVHRVRCDRSAGRCGRGTCSAGARAARRACTRGARRRSARPLQHPSRAPLLSRPRRRRLRRWRFRRKRP